MNVLQMEHSLSNFILNKIDAAIKGQEFLAPLISTTPLTALLDPL